MPEAANEAGRLPLSALLSQVLVAFTIECDNEFDGRCRTGPVTTAVRQAGTRHGWAGPGRRPVAGGPADAARSLCPKQISRAA